MEGGVSVEWANETKATWSSGSTSSTASILRLLGINQTNAGKNNTLYRGSAVEKTEVFEN